MWFIGVEVEQETSAPPPKKNPGSAPDLYVIFGINTTRDISKLSQISLRITISKYHFWYLCQISLQIVLLPIQKP